MVSALVALPMSMRSSSGSCTLSRGYVHIARIPAPPRPPAPLHPRRDRRRSTVVGSSSSTACHTSWCCFFSADPVAPGLLCFLSGQ